MSDPLSNTQLDSVPSFSDTQLCPPIWASLLSHVSFFYYYFDEEVITNLCLWMKYQAAEYFAMIGKKKVNGFIWIAVTQDEMLVLISLLRVIQVMSEQYMGLGWVNGSGAIYETFNDVVFPFLQ